MHRRSHNTRRASRPSCVDAQISEERIRVGMAGLEREFREQVGGARLEREANEA